MLDLLNGHMTYLMTVVTHNFCKLAHKIESDHVMPQLTTMITYDQTSELPCGQKLRTT